MASDFDPDEAAQHVADSVSKKFPDRDGASIERLARQSVNDLKDRPVTDYVEVLAERAVTKQLK